MFRRIVSLLLLPGVLLTQSLPVLAHSHGEMQPAKHGERPHWHLFDWEGHERVDHHHHHHHEHGHRHHNHSHHHHSVAPDGAQSSLSPSPNSLGWTGARIDHDSDAVYCEATSTSSEKVRSSVTLSGPELPLLLSTPEIASSRRDPSFGPASRAGPTSLAHAQALSCPYFLRFHVLLF